MFDTMSTAEIIKLLLPIIIFQLALQLYCLVQIIKKGVANLNKPIWIIIVFCTNLLGPILFLLIGRNKNYD